MLQILKTIMFLSLHISSYTPLDDLYDSDSGDEEIFSEGSIFFLRFLFY